MKKTYIIPVSEMTRIELQTIIMQSIITNGSKSTLKDSYAPEGAEALVQSNNLWDYDEDGD